MIGSHILRAIRSPGALRRPRPAPSSESLASSRLPPTRSAPGVLIPRTRLRPPGTAPALPGVTFGVTPWHGRCVIWCDPLAPATFSPSGQTFFPPASASLSDLRKRDSPTIDTPGTVAFDKLRGEA